MKLTTALVAGAVVAGAAVVAAPAKADTIATVFENYYSNSNLDDGSVYVVNNTGVTFDDLVINGTDLGSLAAGATSSEVFFGDPEFNVGFDVNITVGGTLFSGSFTWGDYDTNVSASQLGTVTGTIPEPASAAVLAAGAAALLSARRRRA